MFKAILFHTKAWFMVYITMCCLLSFTFVTWLVHWPVSCCFYSVPWCWPCFTYSRITYKIYSGGGPSMYLYCVVCYCVIAAPYVRSVVSLHIVTLLMMIRNAQWTMRSLYSLTFFLFWMEIAELAGLLCSMVHYDITMVPDIAMGTHCCTII